MWKKGDGRRKREKQKKRKDIGEEGYRELWERKWRGGREWWIGMCKERENPPWGNNRNPQFYDDDLAGERKSAYCMSAPNNSAGTVCEIDNLPAHRPIEKQGEKLGKDLFISILR